MLVYPNPANKGNWKALLRIPSKSQVKYVQIALRSETLQDGSDERGK